VKLSITAGAASTMDIVPFVQSDPVPGARRMEKSKEQEFRRSLEAKSEALKNDTVVEAEWLKFCGKSKYAYISGLLGHNRVMRKLNSYGYLTRLLYGRRQLLGVKNLVCCETHREVIETIFNEGMI